MRKALIAAALFGTVIAAPASAAVLTFEGQSNTIYTAPITRSGFDIRNPTGQEQHFHEIDPSLFPTEYLVNGTAVLGNDRDTQIAMTLTGGGIFSLGNFSVAATGPGGAAAGATSITVTAFLGAAMVGSFSGLIGFDQYRTYSGAGFGPFDRIVFDGIGGGGGFALDNVNVTPGVAAGVPEPATWAMMMLGFGMLGGVLRRRSVRFAHA